MAKVTTKQVSSVLDEELVSGASSEQLIDSTTRAAVLSHADLAELSKILGTNIRAPQQLIEQCRKLSQIKTEGISVTFEPGLLQRLKSRCPKNVDFSGFLRVQVTKWAHDFVGW